jgi:hypothetical protein
MKVNKIAETWIKSLFLSFVRNFKNISHKSRIKIKGNITDLQSADIPKVMPAKK